MCLTELGAEGEGVVWLGQEECRVAVVHVRRNGELLRGGALEAWISEGQCKWVSERVTAVVFAGMRVVSAYQPIWGSDEEGMIEYRMAVEIQQWTGNSGLSSMAVVAIGHPSVVESLRVLSWDPYFS